MHRGGDVGGPGVYKVLPQGGECGGHVAHLQSDRSVIQSVWIRTLVLYTLVFLDFACKR